MVTLFAKEGNPEGEDKTCPCKQFASASRDNFSDLSMCNRTKTEFSSCFICVILSYKLAIKLSRVVGYPRPYKQHLSGTLIICVFSVGIYL